MKFTTSLLTILAATATLAVPSYNECKNIVEKKYSACTKNSMFENVIFYSDYCIDFENEQCQKLYNNSMSDIINEIPECKGYLDDEDEEEMELNETILKLNYNFMKIACSKDEQGNFCPHSFVNVEKTYNLESLKMKGEEANDIYMEYVKESCRSKKCVDDYLNNIENIKKIYSTITFATTSSEEERQYERISSILKSDTCTAKIGKTSVNANDNVNASSANANGNTVTSNGSANNTTNPTNNNTNDKSNATNGNANGKTDEKNGAAQVTYSSVLFVSLAILLITLY